MQQRNQRTLCAFLTGTVFMLSALPLRGDQLDEEGFARLHRMACGGHVEKIRDLLKAGADVNVQQQEFRGTPLQYASHLGHPDVVRVLLEWDAKVDAVDTFGRTPLMWAAMSGRFDVVRLLVEAGANINAETKTGWTAFRYAEDRDHPEITEFLLKHGAKPPTRTKPEETPSTRSPGQEADAGAPHADQRTQQQIGTVLGRPVFRHEIDAEKPLAQELHRLFTKPVMERYKRRLGERILLTEAEIQAGVEFQSHRAQAGGQHQREFWESIVSSDRERGPKFLTEAEAKLKQADLTNKERRNWEQTKYLAGWMKRLPGSSLVIATYGPLKFQQHLYARFGGGRVLFQQAGLEAFDAMHRWLLRQEQKERIQIADSDLRKTYFEYWTTQNHGAFLRGERRDNHPEWLAFPWNQQEQENAPAKSDGEGNGAVSVP